MAASRPSHRRPHVRPRPKTTQLDRFLDPIDRLTASIYSILIVLTFTLALSVILHGPGYDQPVPEEFGTELFFAVVGAAVAWGLIDGIMFALLSMLERGEKHRFLQELQAAETDDMLFVLGYRWGTYTGSSPWKTGAMLFLPVSF